MAQPEKPQDNNENKGQKPVSSSDLSSFSARAKTLFDQAQERLKPVSVLKTTETKTPPGFAKISERTELEKDIEHMSAKERFDLLKEVVKGKEITEAQRIRLEQVALLRDFAEVVTQMASGEIPTVKEIYAEPKQWLNEHFSELSAKALTDENFTLTNVLPEGLEKLMKENGVPFDLVTTREQILQRENMLVSMARKAGALGTAEAVLNRALTDEFKQATKKVDTTTRLRITSDAAADIALQLTPEVLQSWRKQGMTEEQINQMRQDLISAEAQRKIQREVAKNYMGSVQFSGTKDEMWKQYQNMMGTKWYQMSDETWNTVKEEIIINAPLIVVSGGFGSLARMGFEAGVRGTARTFFRKAGGMLVEGAVFDVAHKGLSMLIGKGEWYKDLPDFAKSVFWSATSLGVFHGAGRIGESAFTKEIILASGEKIPSLTYLGQQIQKLEVKGRPLATKALHEAAKDMMVKGHVEMLAMLTIGAIQNGAYTGNLDEFMNNCGDEILHAYIAVGALKTSGRAVGAVQKRFMPEVGHVQEVTTVEGGPKKEAPDFTKSELAKKYDLRKIFLERAFLPIESAIDRMRKNTLPREQVRELAEKMWGDFLVKLERVREHYRESYIDILLNFDASFSNRDARPIKTWKDRMAYMDWLLSPENLVSPDAKLRRIGRHYDKKIKDLPDEQPGSNEVLELLKVARRTLSPDEQKLPIKEKNALVRPKLREMVAKVSRDVGLMMDRLEQYVRVHANEPIEEILSQLKGDVFDSLPAAVKKKFQIALLRYEKNREIIAVARSSFTPEQLFEKVFGFKPYGKVKSDARSPFAIRLVLEDVDYVRLENRGLVNQPRAEIEQALSAGDTAITTGGLKFGQAGEIPELDGLVNAVRDGYSSEVAEGVFTHEERHTLHHFYYSLGERGGEEKFHKSADVAYEALLEARQKDKIKEKTPRILDLYRKSFIDRAKDEIVAYLKDGTNIARIMDNLSRKAPKGLHDYPSEQRQYLMQSLGSQAEVAYQVMETTYQRELFRICHIAERFLKESSRNQISRDEALAQLSSTPIDRWENLINKHRIGVGEGYLTASYRVISGWRSDIELLGKTGKQIPMKEMGSNLNASLNELDYSEDINIIAREANLEGVVSSALEHNLSLVRAGELNAKDFLGDAEAFFQSLPPELAKVLRDKVVGAINTSEATPFTTLNERLDFASRVSDTLNVHFPGEYISPRSFIERMEKPIEPDIRLLQELWEGKGKGFEEFQKSSGFTLETARFLIRENKNIFINVINFCDGVVTDIAYFSKEATLAEFKPRIDQYFTGRQLAIEIFGYKDNNLDENKIKAQGDSVNPEIRDYFMRRLAEYRVAKL